MRTLIQISLLYVVKEFFHRVNTNDKSIFKYLFHESYVAHRSET